MKTLQIACAAAVFSTVWSIGESSHAAFHNWRIKEIFSNHDGTIQFIEFFTTSGFENFVSNHTLAATSDGNLKAYTIPPGSDFLGSTAGRHFLLATAGFAGASGLLPNFTPLPNKFFDPDAASIALNFANGTEVATFAGSLLPKDGVNSLTDTILVAFPGVDTDNFVVGVNSPTNYAGQTGSVNAPPPERNPADFDEDDDVDGDDLAQWQGDFGANGLSDADDDGDSDGADFLAWQRQLGSGSAGASSSQAAVPEPGGVALALVMLGGATGATRRRSFVAVLPAAP
jgi:hypothetical protein